jgi:hypothetical protein
MRAFFRTRGRISASILALLLSTMSGDSCGGLQNKSPIGVLYLSQQSQQLWEKFGGGDDHRSSIAKNYKEFIRTSEFTSF